jgi:fibronectin-binding autotransporter adhesin
MTDTTQTISNNFDFTASNQKDVPSAPSISLNLPASLYGTYAKSTTIPLGVSSITLAASISGGIKGGINASLGTYSYDYPVTIGVTMARNIGLGETFTVDPELISVDDAMFSMVGAHATANLSLGFTAKISGAVDGDSFAALTIGKIISFPNNYSHSIPGIPGSKITIAEPASFTANSTTSLSGALPSLSASGHGAPVVTASLDLVEFAAKELDDVFPGIGEIDGSYDFEPLGSLTYSLFSAPISVGLGVAQTVTLKPMGIQESLKEMINNTLVSSHTGALGSAFSVTAPSSGHGEIDIDASYFLSFEIVTAYGIEGNIEFSIGGPKATGNILGLDFDEQLGKISFGGSLDLGTVGTDTTNVTTGAATTVYKVFYGLPETVENNQTFTITPSTLVPDGPITLNNNSSVFFTGGDDQTQEPFQLLSDFIINGTGIINASTNQIAVDLRGDINDGTSGPANVKFEGAVYDETGQILITGTTEIVNNTLEIDKINQFEAFPGRFQVDSGAELFFINSASLGSITGSGTIGGGTGSFGSVTVTVGTDNTSTTFSGGFSVPFQTFSLKKVGTGTLTLSGSKFYNGATEVDNGTVAFASQPQISGDLIVNSPGQVTVAGNLGVGSLSGNGVVSITSTAGDFSVGSNNKSTTFSGQIKSTTSGNLIKVGTGTLTLTGASTYNGFTLVENGTLEILNASTSSATATLSSTDTRLLTGAVLDYAVADTVNNNYATSVVISGPGSVAFNGPEGGVIALNGTSTYSGGTTISSGIVDFGAANALGTGPITMTGGAIRADHNPKTIANNFTLSGTIGIGMSTGISGAITLAGDTAVSPSENAGDDNVSGPINLNGFTLGTVDSGPDAAGGSWFDETLTISGAISGSGGITQNDAGLLILEGANTYTGPTIVHESHLQVVNFGSGATAGTLGTGAVEVDATADLQFFNTDIINDDYDIGNNISGSGSVSFIGPDGSVTTVNGDDTYTGGTLIQSGIVNFFSVDPFGKGAIHMAGGAIRATAAPQSLSNTFNLQGVIGIGASTGFTGAVNLFGDTTITPSENAGDDTWSGAVNLNTFTLTTSDTGPNTEGATWADEALTISGNISGAGAIVQASSGGLVLTGDDSYTGGTTLESGTLTIGSGASIGSGTLTLIDDALVTLSSSFTLTNAIDDSLEGSFKVSAGAVDTLSGAISGQGGILVTGGGRLVLSGDDTFQGGTYIDTGSTLELASANAGGGNVVVFGGAAVLQIDAGDGQSVRGLSDLETTDTMIFRGVIANSASVNADDDLVLYQNGVAQYSINVFFSYADDYFATVAVTGGNGQTVGTRVVLLPKPATVASYQAKTSLYNSLAGGFAIADTAANIAANLNFLNGAASHYASLTATDAPVSVNDATFKTDKAALDKIVGGFTVADTAPTIVGDLANLNHDTHAAVTIASGAGTLSGGVAISAPKFTVKGASTSLTIGEALSYVGGFSENTGATINIASGDSLALKGPSTVNATIAGAGALTLAGAATVAASGQITTATWSLSATATVGLNGSHAYSGVFTEGAGAALSVASGATFSLSGTSTLAGVLSGAGTLSSSGGATTVGGAAAISIARWSIAGATTQVAINGASGYAGQFALGAGAQVGIATHGTLALSGAATISGAIGGAGNLTLTGASAATFLSGATVSTASWSLLGSAALTIGENLSYAGAFSAGAAPTVGVLAGDTFTLAGSATLNGLVKGSGTLALSGGATIAGGAILNIAHWSMSGGVTTIGKTLVYAGGIAASGGATLTLSGTGAALTTLGSVSFAGATINGAGTVTTAGATGSTRIAGLTVGGAVSWTNIRTITEIGGGLTLGDIFGNVATLTNAKTGTFDMLDDNGVGVGIAPGDAIANAGLFEKTAGSGVSVVAPTIANTGLILAASGTLDLQGALTATGSLEVELGATLRVDGSVASTQTLSYGGGAGEFSLNDLDVGGAQLFHGSIHGWAAGDSLDVGTAFGAGNLFSFTENKGSTGGVLNLLNPNSGATAAINFNGLSGVVNTANFAASLDSNGGTLLTFHA